MDKEHPIRDALLVGGFFLAYAVVLTAIAWLDARGKIVKLDPKRLEFGRTQRETLLAEEFSGDSTG